jgi:hypothetical protein
MNLQRIVWAAALSLAFVACQNENLETSANLSVSSATLVTDGTAEVVVSNLTDTTNISWSIDPAETAKIIASGLKASIQFSNTGQYVLTVKQGSQVFSAVIAVDSIPTCLKDSLHQSLDSLHHHHHDTIPSAHGDSLANHHHHHGDTIAVNVGDSLHGYDVDSLEHHHHYSGDSITTSVTDSLKHHHHHGDTTSTVSYDSLFHHHHDSVGVNHSQINVKRYPNTQSVLVFENSDLAWLDFRFNEAVEPKNEC